MGGWGAWASLEIFIDKVELGIVVMENREVKDKPGVCHCAPLAETAVRVYEGNNQVSFQKGLDTWSWTGGRNSLSSSSRARGAG